MQAFDSFKCYQCSNVPTDFVMLTCNHILCGDCMAGYESNSPLVTLPCYCGITTNFPTYEKKSPLRNSISKVRSLPTLAKDKNDILDQSYFAINEQSTLDNVSKVSKPSTKLEEEIRKQTGIKNMTHYLKGELSNEIKFMDIRFKRYMNEINRSYSRLVADLNHKYSEMIQLISEKFINLIDTDKVKNLAAIEVGTVKIFKATLEKKLIKLSKQLSFFHQPSLTVDTENIEKENVKHMNNKSLLRPKSTRKSSHENCKYEKITSMSSMNLLKVGLKESKIKKKKMVRNEKYNGKP